MVQVNGTATRAFGRPARCHPHRHHIKRWPRNAARRPACPDRGYLRPHLRPPGTIPPALAIGRPPAERNPTPSIPTQHAHLSARRHAPNPRHHATHPSAPAPGSAKPRARKSKSAVRAPDRTSHPHAVHAPYPPCTPASRPRPTVTRRPICEKPRKQNSTCTPIFITIK